MEIESILHQRDPETYPEKLKVTLQRLTINETPKVVGSTAYAEHKYPSDVDVFENVTVDLEREDALGFYADHFMRVAQILTMDSEELVFSDFKAGEDTNFTEATLEAHGGSFKSFLLHLQKGNLISDDELVDFSRQIDAVESSERKALLLDLLREKRVLRWTLEELILKKKTLLDGHTITLEHALSMPNIVKIDVFTWYSGRWQSVEVFYSLSYRSPRDSGKSTGRTQPRVEFNPMRGRWQSAEVFDPLSYRSPRDSGKSTGRTQPRVEFNPMGSYVQGLLEDIEKYSATSPLKVIKRMWSLARITDCEDMLKALSPALSSDAAALNQVAGDIEMVWELLDKKITSEHIKRIFIEVINFSKRIAPHADVATYHRFQELSAGWFDAWRTWRVTGDLNKADIVETLEATHSLLQETILRMAGSFLEGVDRMNITCANPRFKKL